MEMETFGGHKVNPDEKFWADFHDKISGSINDVTKLYLFAQIGNEVVGFLEGRINTLYEVFEAKRIFHVNAIYVIPDRRKKGIATSLMENALKWALERGCEKADLNVLIKSNAKRL